MLFTGLTIDHVRAFVDAGTFYKGKDYFERNAVADYHFDGDSITGKVKGTKLYSTTVGIGKGKITSMSCSCPVGFACKHGVALALAVVSKEMQLRTERQSAMSGYLKQSWSMRGGKSPKKVKEKSWKTQIGQFGNASPGEPWGKTTKLQILVNLEKLEPFNFPSLYRYDRSEDAQYVLKFRPRLVDLVTGEGSTTVLTWKNISDVRRGGMYWNGQYYQLDHKSAYFLQVLASLLENQGYFMWLPIPEGSEPFVWDLFKNMENYGIDLVAGKNAKMPVEIAKTPIVSSVVISKSSSQDYKLAPTINYGSYQKPTEVMFLGSPVCMALLLPSYPLGFWQDNAKLILAEVQGRIYGAGKDFELTIPKADLEVFKTKHLPQIVKKNVVKSYTEDVVIPKTVEPKIRLTVNKQGKGGVVTDIKLDALPADGSAVYDQTEADELLKNYSLKLSLDDGIWSGREYEGLEAARLVVERLPELQTEPNLIVELDPTIPNYEYVPTEPIIEVGVDAGATTDWFDLDVKVKLGEEQVPLTSLFVALNNNQSHLLLESGKYFSINHPSLAKLRTLFKEAQTLQDKPKSGKLSISRFQLGFFEEVVSLGVVTRQVKAWQESINKLKNITEISPVSPSAQFLGNLRNYQQQGLDWLYFLRSYNLGGILADDMGLGKTVQTISFFTALSKKQRQGRPFLVLAPTSVVENWDAELQKFAPKLTTVILRRGDRTQAHSNIGNADVVVCSYALLLRDFEKLKTVNFDTIILDEAQMSKNHQSRVYSLIKQLSSRSKIALTGTPMENNLLELWTLYSLVAPGLFPKLEAFKESFRTPIEKNQNKEALDTLRARIRPFMLRRKKELVEKELPAKTVQMMMLEMGADHRKIYDLHLTRERQNVLNLVSEGMNKNRFEILKSLTTMRQVCLHPALIDPSYSHVSPAKIEALAEQIELLVSQNHKVLIFSQFTRFLTLAKEVLVKANIQHLYLDGSTKNRGELVKEFQTGNTPVFLISLKAGGFGLNLTAADFCIILDPWWNPQVENQANDRMHRIGQNKPVFVYKFIVKETIEEKVVSLQSKKAKLFSGVLEEGNIFGNQITEAELKQLFS